MRNIGPAVWAASQYLGPERFTSDLIKRIWPEIDRAVIKVRELGLSSTIS